MFVPPHLWELPLREAQGRNQQPPLVAVDSTPILAQLLPVERSAVSRMLKSTSCAFSTRYAEKRGFRLAP